jgi:hypothetical protein
LKSAELCVLYVPRDDLLNSAGTVHPQLGDVAGAIATAAVHPNCQRVNYGAQRSKAEDQTIGKRVDRKP